MAKALSHDQAATFTQIYKNLAEELSQAGETSIISTRLIVRCPKCEKVWAKSICDGTDLRTNFNYCYNCAYKGGKNS